MLQALALLTLLADPASSAPVAAVKPASTTSPVTVTAKPEDRDMVITCKMITPTGTRFLKRMCGPNYQWDERRARGIEYLAGEQRAASEGPLTVK
jgi:hypothetical protein